MIPPDCDTDELPFQARSLPQWLSEFAFWAACGSAVSILLSIAVSQVLLGVAIACFVGARMRVRLPAPWLPLALFLLGTIISLLASGDPLTGMPQVKKLYVYLTLVVLFSVIRRVAEARNLLLAWCALGGVASLFGIIQFARKWQAARALHRDFYEYYLDSRITGFMSHWMTFSGEQMLVLLLLLAYLLFGQVGRKWALAAWCGVAILLGAALLLSDTRSVWIATFVAVLYLAWSRKKILALAIPVLALLVLAVSPASIQERAVSIVRPKAQVDSNGFRLVVWKTGLRMVEAHPLLGLGPEEVHKHFYEWLPPDIARPLPPGYYGHLHSIYVHYAAERGIPTMLMLLWMLGRIVYQSAAALRRVGRGRGDIPFLLHGAIACVIAILVEGFFELNLGDSEVLTMFLAITACAYVGIGDLRNRTAAATTV